MEFPKVALYKNFNGKPINVNNPDVKEPVKLYMLKGEGFYSCIIYDFLIINKPLIEFSAYFLLLALYFLYGLWKIIREGCCRSLWAVGIPESLCSLKLAK